MDNNYTYYDSTARLLQDSSYEQALYTEAQELTLIVLPYFSAPLSVVGSGLILYVIWKERQTKLKETYHRLMLGLSTMNFMNSLSNIVLGHWVIPAGIDMPGARGTTTTCSIAGFFLNLFFGSMWYSFFLSLCFALRIKCECRPRCIARYCETIGHFLGFFLPILGGSVAAADEEINPMEQLTGWCWTTDFPNGCSDNDEIECIRGEGYTGGTDAAGIIFLFVGIIICMGLITLKVRQTEMRMRAYGSPRHSLQRTKQSGVQALWYIGVFFISYFPIVMLMILGTDYSKHSQGLYFAFAFLTKLLSPLQGFFNAFIYFRRNFRTLLQDGRSLSFIPNLLETLHMSTSRNITSTTSASIEVAATSDIAGNNSNLGAGDLNAERNVNECSVTTERTVNEEGVSTEGAMEEINVKSGAAEEADRSISKET